MRFAFAAGALVALSLAIGARAQAPPRYNVVELRPFSLEGYFQAAAINNLGQVTGGITNPASSRPIVFRSGADAAFEDSNILDRRIPSPPYAFPIFSDGMSINDLGQVAGFGYLHGESYSGFRIPANGTLDVARDDIGQLAPGLTRALGINSLGQVVGQSGDRPFRTGPNAKINPATDALGTLGGLYGGANDINDAGVVVGSALTGEGDSHAFRSLPNGMSGPLIDLGTISGGNSQALAINNRGEIVGVSQGSNRPVRAYKIGPGEVITAASDLGTLGGVYANAVDINDLGWVVGNSQTATNAMHAFVHDGNQMWDLNDLIPQDSPWLLLEPSSINNRGQILVHAQRGNEVGYLRLDPVPEPAGILLCTTGLLLTWGRKRR